LIGLTREDYPNYYEYPSITFSKVKQKPRVVEERVGSDVQKFQTAIEPLFTTPYNSCQLFDD
jgi:hypothetical protein